MVDAHLGKKYKLVSSENFDEIMKTWGVGLMFRKAGGVIHPVIELTKQGDEYHISSTSTFKNHLVKFKPGVEFEHETPDGRKVKSTITIEGNTLKEVQIGADGGKTIINWTFSDDEAKIVMTHDNITCTRIFKLQ